MTKVIIDPKTGRMMTVDHETGDQYKKNQSGVCESLKQLRQDTKDMIAGNVQFHKDEFENFKPQITDE